MLFLSAPANYWPQPREQQWFNHINVLCHFAPRQVNSELRTPYVISITLFSSCWTRCFGVTQKRLPKDQAGRGKWWPWCGAGHQEQPGTDVAQSNSGPQAGWQWHAEKKQMWTERPEFPHGPGKHCLASVTQENVLWPGTDSLLPGTALLIAWPYGVRLKGNAWVSCISQGQQDDSLFLILATPREVWLPRRTSETQTRIGNSKKYLTIAK